MEHLAAWEAWTSTAERRLVEYLHPGFDYDARVTRGWPLTSLYAASLVLAGYGVLVLVGLAKYALTARGKKAAPEVDTKPRGKAAESELVNPADMFRREPIRYLQVLYNSVQVALCGWMMVMAAASAFSRGAPPVCGEFRPAASDIAAVEWVFYLSKVLDFFDTFFIVARGSWAQFSFLHVYHHSSIFFIYWALTVMAYDGDVYYTIIANSFVHLVMYYYYTCTCFGFKPKWGQQLTQLQMVQFVTMNAQAMYILWNGCPYPSRVTAFYLAYIISLFALFMQFYLGKYTKGSARKPAADSPTSDPKKTR